MYDDTPSTGHPSQYSVDLTVLTCHLFILEIENENKFEEGEKKYEQNEEDTKDPNSGANEQKAGEEEIKSSENLLSERRTDTSHEDDDILRGSNVIGEQQTSSAENGKTDVPLQEDSRQGDSPASSTLRSSESKDATLHQNQDLHGVSCRYLFGNH